MSGLIVGRTEELAAFVRVLDVVDRAPMVVLQGEPGIGKTRLLTELAARAETRDFLVLSGRASEFEGELPLGVFVDAMDAHLGSVAQQELDVLGSERLDELAVVFPALAKFGRGRGAALQEERFRTIYAIRALLEQLATQRPVLLALDDVHWADPASLEAILHLARRRLSAQIVLALALRPSHAPPKTMRGLSTMAQLPDDEILPLVPLTRDEANALLDNVEDKAAIYTESGGNPFYLTELARYSAATPSAGDLPERVALAIAEEIDGLSETGQVAAKAAALVAERFDPDLLAAASGLPDVFMAIDELIERDLIRPTEVPSEFRFRHPLVRSAVYEATEPGWRLAAHRRVASWLTDRAASPTLIAPHVERSARTGDQAAINVLRDAGEATHVRAPAIAAHWYEAALKLTDSDDGRAELLMALATSLGAAGQLSESLRVTEQALPLLPAKAGVALTAFSATIEHLRGPYEHPHKRLVNALRELPDESSPEAAALHLELSVNALYASQWNQVVDHALRALPAARTAGDPALNAAAAAMVAFGHSCQGQLAPAAPYLDEAATLLDALSDDEVARRLNAPYYLGWAEVYGERFPAAIRHLERGVAVARQTGAGYLYGPTTVGLAWALGETGQLAEAIEQAQHVVESARLTENPQGLLFALGSQARWTSQTGDLAATAAACEEALAIIQEIRSNVVSAVAACTVGSAVLEAGDPQRCIDVILAECGGPSLSRVAGVVSARCCEALTRAELALGNKAAAEHWATRAQSYADASDARLVHAHALRAQAAVLLASDDPKAAEAAIESAEAAEAVGAPVHAGRARILAGRAFASAGDTRRAVAELVNAEATLAACGAQRWRAEAAAVLRELGHRAPHRFQASAGPYGLSARERDVAALLAQGKTNKQIAERLFIGVRTVETHVARILSKIGVDSRAAAAAALAREN